MIKKAVNLKDMLCETRIKLLLNIHPIKQNIFNRWINHSQNESKKNGVDFACSKYVVACYLFVYYSIVKKGSTGARLFPRFRLSSNRKFFVYSSFCIWYIWIFTCL